MWVTNVAGKDVHVVANILWRVIKPTPRVEGIVEDERSDAVTLANQGFCKVRANKAVGTCDEDSLIFHRFKLKSVRLEKLPSWH